MGRNQTLRTLSQVTNLGVHFGRIAPNEVTNIVTPGYLVIQQFGESGRRATHRVFRCLPKRL